MDERKLESASNINSLAIDLIIEVKKEFDRKVDSIKEVQNNKKILNDLNFFSKMANNKISFIIFSFLIFFIFKTFKNMYLMNYIIILFLAFISNNLFCRWFIKKNLIRYINNIKNETFNKSFLTRELEKKIEKKMYNNKNFMEIYMTLKISKKLTYANVINALKVSNRIKR